MKLARILACASAAVAVTAAGAASASSVFVNATDDIFLSGQTTVPTNFPYHFNPTDGAGTLPASIGVSAGEHLTITASGIASCCSGSTPSGPGGLGGSSSISGYGDVGAYSGVEFPLVGVFGGPGVSTPWSIFVIGSSDSVVVPTGATKLYLGIPDALGFNGSPGYYDDNTGGFQVNVAGVPEPSAWSLMLLATGALGGALRRRRSAGMAVA
jgi:hypothetical protein